MFFVGFLYSRSVREMGNGLHCSQQALRDPHEGVHPHELQYARRRRHGGGWGEWRRTEHR